MRAAERQLRRLGKGPRAKHGENVQAYLRSQHKVAAERAARAQKFMELTGMKPSEAPRGLGGESPLDAALRSRPRSKPERPINR